MTFSPPDTALLCSRQGLSPCSCREGIRFNQMNNEHITPDATCPTCAYKMDRATGLENSQAPKPGDVSLCVNCGEAMIFKEDLTLRLAELDDLIKLGAQQHALVTNAQACIRFMRKRR